MRRYIIFLAVVGLMACAAVAVEDPAQILVTVTNTATGNTNLSNAVYGYVDSVEISVSDGVATGVVAVYVQPTDSLMDTYNIATATVTNQKVWRPRVDGETVAGAANTSDPPEKFYIMGGAKGDKVYVKVTGSQTNVIWRATIKTSRQ